nr:putative neuroblastoma breakpoint family member 5 [Oryctolagus cuniculus]
MAGSSRAPSDSRVEIQDLCSQLVKSQQESEDLKERFPVSETIAYALANQLQKYENDDGKDDEGEREPLSHMNNMDW